MNVLRLQGLALILSAVSLLIALLGPQSIAIIGPQAAMVSIVLSSVLFILGIPAVYSAQPTGWIGMAGIALLEIAALIALGFRFNIVPWPSDLGDSLSLTSAIAGTLGALIVGWFTTREHVFPAWVGWAFMAYGLLNLAAGAFQLNALPGVLIPFLPVLQAVVLFAYGYFIFQKPVSITANKYGVASH